MALLRLTEVSFSYGGANILERVSLQVEPGERIGLLGRNGAGKSTLMKLMEGEIQPDHGEIERSPGLKIARLAQEVPRGAEQTVFDEVASGLGPAGELVARLHTLARQPDAETDPERVAESLRLHQKLDTETGWKLQQQIEGVLTLMGLDGDAPFEVLSSGKKRRVLLAKALVSQPDILLLDEPTNHLDIDAVQWLEDFLLRVAPTLIFVTHDRAFLQKLATRIVEVERARLFDWTCDYATFQTRKAAALEAEAQQEALFDRRLADEEIWIRTGVKARRTRNEGRVRALERMREERQARRAKVGNVKLLAQDAERSGNLVLDAQGVTHEFGEQVVLDDVSATIYRGDKIGILGPNGAGKTTLLRILLGELAPSRGQVRLGTNLQISYFDQLRAQLDENRSAAENVTEGGDSVVVNGKTRHIVSYLRDFLFTGERARSLVRYLSGGERNRLLLARMFTRPANLLVLDEPTNDLDAETLELLEAMLVDYPGTILVVSHDRTFLNNVVTSTLVFEGEGTVKEYAGGYDDWVRARADASDGKAAKPSAAGGFAKGTAAKGESAVTAKSAATEPARPPRARRLTFKEERELEALPATIDRLEVEQADLNTRLGDPAFYQQSRDEISKVTDRVARLADELQAAYTRWEELEALRS